MKFTVLIPTFNHGVIIHSAIGSVLEQTVDDLELFIVCDGSPPETHSIVAEYEARDKRVRAFKFEKGERHGEASRHKALEEATGEAVAYLADDDFWFPDHLAVMRELLADADFATTRQVETTPDYLVSGETGDLAEARTRERMAQEKYNFFGPTVAAHRLDAYWRLPQGWSPAPEDLWTDLCMWRKWIRAGGVRFRSDNRVTSLHIPRVSRPDQSEWTAINENAYWRAVFRDPFIRKALQDVIPADRSPIQLAIVAAQAVALREAALAAAESEKRAYMTDRDAALVEIDAQRAALNDVLNSKVWRATAPLRAAVNRFRAPRGRRDAS
ncbi:MAG: glycosyltransferase family 2 protein [Parvularculaceae bacterium]